MASAISNSGSNPTNLTGLNYRGSDGSSGVTAASAHNETEKNKETKKKNMKPGMDLMKTTNNFSKPSKTSLRP